MILLELFLGFLKVGCFSFGGAYFAIPLIRETVLSHGWLTDDAVSYMIAVSESTPGPIMVNMATYVGSSQAGFLGALVATTAVVLPSFLVILLVCCFWVMLPALIRSKRPRNTGSAPSLCAAVCMSDRSSLRFLMEARSKPSRAAAIRSAMTSGTVSRL